MEMSKNSGSSVDPPRQMSYEILRYLESESAQSFLVDSNLSTKLILKLLHQQHGKDLSQQELEDLLDKIKGLKGKSELAEEGSTPEYPTLFPVRNNPDSVPANYFRNELKREVGDDFNELAYKVINMIPDADWMEFARTALKVDEHTEQSIRISGSPTTNMKYDMIKHWQTSRRKAGEDASGKALLDLAIKFLTQKGLNARIVQQNFGTIHAQTFNAFCPSNHGAPMQASA